MTNNSNYIDENDLRNDEKMISLYGQAIVRHNWPCSTRAVLDFFALAEKALQDDKDDTPGKLFSWLVKERRTERITDRQEIRAEQRLMKLDKQDIVDRFSGSDAATPADSATHTETVVTDDENEDIMVRNIGFLPSVAVQCFFPQKSLPKNVRNWEFHHGRTSLLIEAGKIADRHSHNNVFRECHIPAGYLPRLLFAHICGESIKTKTEVIDMGRSMRQFMGRMGISVDGRAGKRLTTAVENLAAASFILARWNADRGVLESSYSRLVGKISFWLEKDVNQMSFWQPELVLSPEFYKELQNESHVPIDMDHLGQLTRSPRRMDLYTWMSYRTPLVKRGKIVSIRLSDLQGLFAPDINNPRLFKQRLRQDLKIIAKVYSLFNVEIAGDMLKLRYSPPPVPYKTKLLTP